MSPFLAEVSIQATPILHGAHYLTNSIFVACIVLLVVLVLATRATRNMQMVPHRMQNLFEFLVEFLYSQVEGIVGKRFAPKAFPLLATIFIFIVISNWMGLFPGVGTIGYGEGPGAFTVTHMHEPLLRPATADLNMTLGIALFFMLAWTIVLIRDVGLGGFLKHTFGGPGGIKMGAVMRVFLGIVFFMVGVIELVSIAFRPVSLSLRLFGNIFAGESLLHTMQALGDKLGFGPVLGFLSSVIFPLPFYFLEILVGLLQGVVFALLCAVYIQLLTGGHDDEHGHGEADAHH